MEKGERKDVASRPELAILLLSFESRRHLTLRARLRSKPEGKASCRRTQTFPAIRWDGDIDLENSLWRGNCGSVLSSAPTAQKQFLSIIFYDSQNSQNRWKRGHEYPTWQSNVAQHQTQLPLQSCEALVTSFASAACRRYGGVGRRRGYLPITVAVDGYGQYVSITCARSAQRPARERQHKAPRPLRPAPRSRSLWAALC